MLTEHDEIIHLAECDAQALAVRLRTLWAKAARDACVPLSNMDARRQYLKRLLAELRNTLCVDAHIVQ